MVSKPVPFVKVFLPVKPAEFPSGWSLAQWPEGLALPAGLYARIDDPLSLNKPRNIPVVENTPGGLWIWAIENGGSTLRTARAGEVGLKIIRAKSTYVRYEYKIPVGSKLREVYTAVFHAEQLGVTGDDRQIQMPAWFFSRGEGSVYGGKPTINDLADMGWSVPDEVAVLRDLVLENAQKRLVHMPTRVTDQCCVICQRPIEHHEWVIQFTVPQAGAGLFFANCYETPRFDGPKMPGMPDPWGVDARNKVTVPVGDKAEVHPECVGLTLPEV